MNKFIEYLKNGTLTESDKNWKAIAQKFDTIEKVEILKDGKTIKVTGKKGNKASEEEVEYKNTAVAKEVKNKLKEIITKLFDYVGTHFPNEQKYMESVDYPELENHKFLHKNMLMMLTTLISELNKMELKDIEKSLFNFIEEYFIRHIVLEDKKIQLWNTSLKD